METEKTKLCRFAAFIKLMFRTPGSVQTKVENDTENELNSSEAKIDADENFNGGDASDNFKANIGSDENFEDEDSFGKNRDNWRLFHRVDKDLPSHDNHDHDDSHARLFVQPNDGGNGK